MDSDDLGVILLIVFLCTCVAIISGRVVHNHVTTKFQTAAAQTSCAQFNPSSGEFEWK